jgi:uncharacterized protein
MAILEKADVCRIAFRTIGAPYIVPMNFGFVWEEKIELFFHCADQGRKLELLSKNNMVGFELDTDHGLLTADKPCNWGMTYKSIIGTGKLMEIIDPAEKKSALDSLMKHYGLTKGNLEYDEMIFNKTKILKLEVHEITGKEKKTVSG